jgi:hypothetical protein
MDICDDYDDFQIPKTKRKLSLTDDDNLSTHSAGPCRKYKKKDNDEVSSAMGQLSSSMSTMARAFVDRSEASKQQELEDSHGIWSKLLAMKLRQLPHNKAERIKLQIDSIVLDALEGQ